MKKYLSPLHIILLSVIGAALLTVVLILRRSDWLHWSRSPVRTTEKTAIATPEPAHPPGFHPDQVVELDWRTGGHRSTFQRAHANEPWVAKERGLGKVQSYDDHQFARQLQELLAALSVLQTHKSDESDACSVEDAAVEFSLSVLKQGNAEEREQGSGPLDVLQGVSDGRTLCWNEGPLRGRETPLTGSLAGFIKEGQHLFEKHQFEVCHARPKLLALRDVDHETETIWKRDKGTWSLSKHGTSATMPLTTAAANRLEEWIGANCQIAVERFIAQPFAAEALEDMKLGTLHLRIEFESKPGAVVRCGPGHHCSVERTDARNDDNRSAGIRFMYSPALSQAIHSLSQMP